MPNATPRANARAMPKTTRKPETAKAFVLRTLAAETRRLAALPDKAFEEKTSAPSAKQPDLLYVSDKLDAVNDLIEAAYMAANSLPNDQSFPLTRLLDITSTQLESAIEDLGKITEART